MGPHAGPHLPRLATRRVVPRDARHPRRGCARSESAPRHRPPHIPADSAVSPPALVRRPARRQRPAAAPLLGTELRRLPAVQVPAVPGAACAQGLVPALQWLVPRRLGRLRVVCVPDVAGNNGGQSEALRRGLGGEGRGGRPAPRRPPARPPPRPPASARPAPPSRCAARPPPRPHYDDVPAR